MAKEFKIRIVLEWELYEKYYTYFSNADIEDIMKEGAIDNLTQVYMECVEDEEKRLKRIAKRRANNKIKREQRMRLREAQKKLKGKYI